MMHFRWRVYIYIVCFYLISFTAIKCGDVVETAVDWAGGWENKTCHCELYNTTGTGIPYACTSGEGSGDWSSGVKYFHDPQTDQQYVLTQVIVYIYGSFDCNANQVLTVMLNEQEVGTITVPINAQSFCDHCKNCLADTSPMIISSITYDTGFPSYNIGFPNELSLLLQDQNSHFCISRATLALVYNLTAQLPDSSSSHSWELDAPAWFWTLVAAAGVIVLVLLLTLFILWRRSSGSGSQNNSKSWGGYKALSTTEYLDPRQLEDITIDLSEFTMDREIGHGSFGLVYKAVWRGTEVAVKRLPHSSVQEQQILLEFMKEAFIMRQLRHPNVLQVLGACLDPPCIVMEYMPRGSLFHLIHNPEVSLEWPIVQKIAIEICRGMAYLHGCNPPLIHRDLKPHNLLVDETWRVKVCDFGLSRFWEAKRDMTACGTPAYAAPEVLRNSAYSVSADVYSFALVLWELITRQPLYPGMPPFQIIFTVGTQGTRPAIPPTCDPTLARVITDCWAEDPASRPSFVTIAERIAAIGKEPSGGAGGSSGSFSSDASGTRV